jgi:hypothetical protein
MTPAESYGSRFAKFVADYLAANSLKSLGQINGRILAELSQEFHDKNRAVVKRQVKLAADEEWLKGIEGEPAMQGIDVRQELGKCQFWCKQRQRVCTRKTFENWLLKADRSIIRSYDGATSKPAKPQPPKPRFTLDTPVPGWPRLLRFEVFPNTPDEELDLLCSKDWSELPADIREKIIHAA